MSALAIGLFIVVTMLFILAVLVVVLVARSTYRRTRMLADELGRLNADAGAALRSAAARRNDGMAAH